MSSTHREHTGEGHYVRIQHCERRGCDAYLGVNYPSEFCDGCQDPTGMMLTSEEQTVLRLAATASLNPMERLEVGHFLGYPDPMPTGADRVEAVVVKILDDRAARLDDMVRTVRARLARTEA